MPLYTFLHSFLNAFVQIANKMGLQNKCEQNLILLIWPSFIGYMLTIEYLQLLPHGIESVSIRTADRIVSSRNYKEVEPRNQ
jgi:hypothetical protein